MNHGNRKHSLKLVKVALSLSGDEPTGGGGNYQQQQHEKQPAQHEDNSGGRMSSEGAKSSTREVMLRQWLKICRKSSRC